MRFNHLGLPVRDERRSQQFYSAYFGFDLATAQQYPDGTVIIRNADGFDLALRPAGGWFGVCRPLMNRTLAPPDEAKVPSVSLTGGGLCGQIEVITIGA